jgi:fatty acid desaturase
MKLAAGRSRRALPVRLNLGLAAALLAVNALQFFVVPTLLLPRSRWWALVLVAIVPTGHTLLSLTHEAVHGIFHPSARVNRGAGRVLAIAFGASFDVYRTVHLMHHKYNRTPIERVELYGYRGRRGLFARIAFYYDLLGGNYYSQLLGLAVLPLIPGRLLRPRIARLDPNGYTAQALRTMAAPRTLRAIREDTLALALLLGGAFWLYGRWWPLLAAALAARALLTSLFNYLYHYGSPLDDVLHGYNLELPMPLSKLLLHFNFHGVHHRNPSLPWTELPRAFRRSEQAYDEGFATAALRQLRGPLEAAVLPLPTRTTELSWRPSRRSWRTHKRS